MIMLQFLTFADETRAVKDDDERAHVVQDGRGDRADRAERGQRQADDDK